MVQSSQVVLEVKKPPANAEDVETQVRSLGQEDPWRGAQQPAPVFLPGESHVQRSLEGCSSWSHKELDTTEHAPTESQVIVEYLEHRSGLKIEIQDLSHRHGGSKYKT